MSIVNQPDILPGAFAAEGDKNTIPANNDGTSGLASVAKGFPPITQQPLASGGLPPQRADFNGIFNMFSEFLLYIQSGGVFNYNNSLDYKPPAVIWGNNNLYKCVAQNGPNTSAGVQPVTNTSYWQPLVPVSSVSASNNIITVNDEAGEPTKYTIDTLASAPGASDNSNKIPTTAWVQTWAKNFINALDDNLEVQWSGSTFTVPALGITGLMAQNGYISLGKLFGGLILQWGNSVGMRIDATPYKVFFNITMPGYLWSNATINSGDIPDIVIVPYIQNADQTGLQILIDYETGHTYVPGASISNVLWIAIGYART